MNYREDQYGALIIFRKDATKEEIAKAMNALKDVLAHVPERWSQVVHGFDSRFGAPVWYIP